VKRTVKKPFTVGPGRVRCGDCQKLADDICPFCGKAVCQMCAEREGESCCDPVPINADDLTERAMIYAATSMGLTRTLTKQLDNQALRHLIQFAREWDSFNAGKKFARKANRPGIPECSDCGHRHDVDSCRDCDCEWVVVAAHREKIGGQK
jgi:hypothetical protein